MKAHDLTWLADILDSANLVRQFTQDVTFEEFRKDVMRHSAVARHPEIMGEAAKNVSAAYKADHPEIPWKRMAGMRDVLIHAYGKVDLAELWGIATHDASELIRNLEPLVPPPDAEDA
ncbi:MAG TPA: DUF86 domain-containing protein [Longimicrobium sp.]|nr:DUF86 domain-containing protein [Longimicrobium sp.]